MRMLRGKELLAVVLAVTTLVGFLVWVRVRIVIQENGGSGFSLSIHKRNLVTEDMYSSNDTLLDSIPTLKINVGDWMPPLTIMDLTPRDPISIDGDGDFTPANGVNGGGSGVPDDPYIIENWAISAFTAHGIYIRNTTAYFTMRNCLVENGRDKGYSGVYLYNVQNGEIEGTIANNNNYGIRLSSSSNSTLVNNAGSNNNEGILLFSSSSSILNSNAYFNSREVGLASYYSNNNTLTNNEFSNSNYGGISLLSSDNNTLVNNTSSGNSGYGISLDYSSNNFLDNNEFSGNSSNGISIDYSANNTLRNNISSKNNPNFRVRGSSISEFEHDIDTSNLVDGKPICYLVGSSDIVIGPEHDPGYLALVRCDNVRVDGIVSENSQGVILAGTENSWVGNSFFRNNEVGIQLYYSNYNTISNNTYENPSYYSIDLTTQMATLFLTISLQVATAASGCITLTATP